MSGRLACDVGPSEVGPSEVGATRLTMRMGSTSIGLLLFLSYLPSLSAQEEPIRVRLSSSRATARVGETGEVLAIVEVDATAAGPLLVTPTSDGPAIEVVRGRLLRADAEDPRVTPLRFHVPFVASSPGDAVVRVRVDGWSCVSPGEGQPERCHTVRTEAAITLTVRAP